MTTYVGAGDGVSLRGYRTARVPMNQTNSDTLWPEYEARLAPPIFTDPLEHVRWIQSFSIANALHQQDLAMRAQEEARYVSNPRWGRAAAVLPDAEWLTGQTAGYNNVRFTHQVPALSRPYVWWAATEGAFR